MQVEGHVSRAESVEVGGWREWLKVKAGVGVGCTAGRLRSVLGDMTDNLFVFCETGAGSR